MLQVRLSAFFQVKVLFQMVKYLFNGIQQMEALRGWKKMNLISLQILKTRD